MSLLILNREIRYELIHIYQIWGTTGGLIYEYEFNFLQVHAGYCN